MRVNNDIPECLKGVKFERKPINVYKINSKIEAQRDVDLERAKHIGENWIENFNHDPIISINTKTGMYEQPSGQHTTAGYIWRLEHDLEKTVTLMCRVANDLTTEQLNAIFAYEALMSKNQSSARIIMGLWNSNDECIHNINRAVNTYGYTLPCNKNGNMVIGCVQCLIDLNINDLKKCLAFISAIFPKDLRIAKKLVNKKAVEATFIKSVKLFLDVWGDNGNYDIKKLKSAIVSSESHAKQLLKDAKDIVQYEKHPTRQLAYLLAKTYNDYTRKNKLRFSDLDDYFQYLD